MCTVGGHPDICSNNKILFHQLTTSAIANEPLPKAAYYFMRMAAKMHKAAYYLMRAAVKMHQVCNGFHFYHHHCTQANNYGIVQINHHSPPVNKTSSTFSVIFSLNINPKSVQEEGEVEVAIILSSELRTFTSHLNLPSVSPILSSVVSPEHGDLAHAVCTFSMQYLNDRSIWVM
jgi:hypothetical protein